VEAVNNHDTLHRIAELLVKAQKPMEWYGNTRDTQLVNDAVELAKAYMEGR
jgi:hypothetical protein